MPLAVQRHPPTPTLPRKGGGRQKRQKTACVFLPPPLRGGPGWGVQDVARPENRDTLPSLGDPSASPQETAISSPTSSSEPVDSTASILIP